MSVDFSVILATRNRAESLRETLAALRQQETGGAFTYEVLVVDNASTDATRAVVSTAQATGLPWLRYVYEAWPGKPWALNTGLRQAHGALLAFTDDDVLPTATWLQALWRCFQEEPADGVTGRILPRWLAPRPAWLTDQLALGFGTLGCLDHGPHRLRSRERHDCRWVGGNLAIRRAVINQVGDYDSRMGRVEDTEYYYRCVRHGLHVVYEPTALVYHTIWPERMTPEYFRWWHHTTGYYHAHVLPWRASHVLTVVPVDRYLQSLGLALKWGLAFLRRRPWAERFSYELLLRLGFSAWLHRLQLWPRWWRAVLTSRNSPHGAATDRGDTNSPHPLHHPLGVHPPSPEAPPVGGEEGEARVLLRSRADKATAKQNTMGLRSGSAPRALRKAPRACPWGSTLSGRWAWMGRYVSRHGMSFHRMVVAHLMIFLILFGSLTSCILDRRMWPFLNYWMFSSYHSNCFQWIVPYGITAEGEIRLPSDRYWRPLNGIRLDGAFSQMAHFKDAASRRTAAAQFLANRYREERARDPHPSGPEIRGLRLYQCTWRLQPGALNRNEPDSRALLAEVVLEQEPRGTR